MADNRHLLAVIGDEDTITGMLLAGIGQVEQATAQKNFFIVESRTTDGELEQAFEELTQRADIAILLVNQHLAERIRVSVDGYTKAFPAILEIPSKEHPYGEYNTIPYVYTHLFSPFTNTLLRPRKGLGPEKSQKTLWRMRSSKWSIVSNAGHRVNV